MDSNIYCPCGYGLSYGRAQYSHLSITKDGRQGISVSFTLSNPSATDICETAQVYVSAPSQGGKTSVVPLAQLCDFRRIDVKAGESRELTFQIPVDRLMTVGDDGQSRLIRGEYTITVGGAAPSARTRQLGVSMAEAKVKM